MKFNWVNILAALLIIVGGYLLVARRIKTKPEHHVPTVEEAKADIERQIEGKLGRPLSDAETDMIEVGKSGDQINITLHQPLTGRIYQALHSGKSATSPSSPQMGVDPLSGLTGPDLRGASGRPLAMPTTAPAGVPAMP